MKGYKKKHKRKKDAKNKKISDLQHQVSQLKWEINSLKDTIRWQNQEKERQERLKAFAYPDKEQPKVSLTDESGEMKSFATAMGELVAERSAFDQLVTGGQPTEENSCVNCGKPLVEGEEVACEECMALCVNCMSEPASYGGGWCTRCYRELVGV